MTAAVALLRLRWPSLSPRTRSIWLRLALLLFVPTALSYLTHWETASVHVNDLFLWIRILGYELIVIFFTLLRPRWLTTSVAVVLLLPLLAASIIAPLSALFDPHLYTVQPIADDYFLETAPWTSGEHANSGIDFTLFRQPPHLHLLRRGLRAGRLYNSQCDTAHVVARFDPIAGTLDVHCPPLPGSTPLSPTSGADLRFPL